MDPGSGVSGVKLQSISLVCPINMSKGHTLRALVTERLTAAAEEIFSLIGRTVAEYEEELCRYKEENRRKQELLDSMMSPRVVLLLGGPPAQTTHPSLNPQINTQITPQVKKELQEPDMKFDKRVCIKSEEPSSSSQQQQQMEYMEHIQADQISLQTHKLIDKDSKTHAETGYKDEDTAAPFSWSDLEKEAESDGDLCYRRQTMDEPNTSLYSEVPGSANNGPSCHPCPICQKIFRKKQELQMHLRIHTGEKPFVCPFCEKTFTQHPHLKSHVRIHTGDRPFLCPTCNKAFRHKGNLDVHMRLHTGERPYSCSICEKRFPESSSLKKHLKSHARKALRMGKVRAADNVEMVGRDGDGDGGVGS